VAARALPLAAEERLASQLGLARLVPIEVARGKELRGRREVDDVLERRHGGQLAAVEVARTFISALVVSPSK